MDRCPVCTEFFTTATRKCVECYKCQYKSCLRCTQAYVLTVPEVQCMSCREPWDDNVFVHTNLSTGFVNNRLFEHQLDVLFQLEKSLLPETVEWLARREAQTSVGQQQRLLQGYLEIMDDYEVLHDLVEELVKERVKSCRDAKQGSYEALWEAVRAYIDTAQPSTLISKLKVVIFSYLQKHHLVVTEADTQSFLAKFKSYLEELIDRLTRSCESPGASQFLQRCNRERCPNFLHVGKGQSFGECKACKTKQCLQCHETVLSDAHECDASLVATLRVVQKTSRPCPNCKELIEKISGCDQMFCTRCNTPFDWSTNTVIKGRIHNPHYFEWLAKQRVDDDDDDDDEADDVGEETVGSFFERGRNFVLLIGRFFGTLTSILEQQKWHTLKYSVYLTNTLICLTSYWRLMNECLDEYVPYDEEDDPQDPVAMYREHRVEFFRGYITELEWKRRLREQRRESLGRMNVRRCKLELVNSSFQVFKELQTLLPSEHKEDYASILDLLPLFESTLRKCIGLVQVYNNKARYTFSSSDCVLLHPTQDMLEFGYGLVKDCSEYKLESSVTDGFLFSEDTVVYQACSFLQYDYSYEKLVMEKKQALINTDTFLLQKVSSTNVDYTVNFTDAEKRVVKWSTFIQAEGMTKYYNKGNLSHERDVEVLMKLMSDDWHHEYRPLVSKALAECRKKDLPVTVLYNEHMNIFDDALPNSMWMLGKHMIQWVQDQYLKLHEQRLITEVIPQGYLLIVLNCVPTDVKPLLVECWIPDFTKISKGNNKLRKQQVLESYRAFPEQIHALTDSLNNNTSLNLRKRLKVPDAEAHLKKIEPFLNALTAEDVDNLEEHWRRLKRAVYLCPCVKAFFRLEPSMGHHCTREVNGVTVQLPAWFEFIFNRRQSVFLDASFAYHNVLFTLTCEGWNLLLSEPLFTVYLDGHPATFDELVYVLYLHEEWTDEVLREMYDKVWSFNMIRNKGTPVPKPHRTEFVFGNGTGALKVVQRPAVLKVADMVCDKVREVILKKPKDHYAKYNAYLAAAL